MTSRVQDAISWRRPRRQRRGVREGAGAATGVVRAAVHLALSIANGDAPAGGLTSLGAEPPRVPRDPERPATDLPCVVVGGSADWLPADPSEPVRLWATRSRVWVALPGGDVELDRGALSLGSLELAPGADGPWTLETPCSATVSGPRLRLVVEGSWLAIAWLGHLVGWPDPGPPAARGS